MTQSPFRESKDFEKWFDFAQQDLDVAFLLNREQSFTDTICNFAHQSVEKALKAFLISRGVLDFPHTHDLEALLAQCAKLSPNFSDWTEEIKILNKYYIETKYPADMPIDYSRQEAQKAIEMATDILGFIKAQVRNRKQGKK